MDKIAILPAIPVLYLYFFKGYDARQLFILVFLPMLTLIPAYYETKLVQGIPEISFWSSAIITVFILWIFKDKLDGYRFSFLDLVIIIQIITNVGAALKMLPITGVTLPLVSYGGSSLVPLLAGIGLLLGAARRHAHAVQDQQSAARNS